MLESVENCETNKYLTYLIGKEKITVAMMLF